MVFDVGHSQITLYEHSSQLLDSALMALLTQGVTSLFMSFCLFLFITLYILGLQFGNPYMDGTHTDVYLYPKSNKLI